MNAIDLFCGAGGLSTGLRSAGWDVVVAIDNDDDSLQTYQANHHDTKVLKWNLRDLPPDFDDWVNKVDLIAGGPPCQPFSVAGNQKAGEDDRDCIPYFIKAVEKISPKAFILENVPGLKTPRHRTYLSNVIRGFVKLGYFVTVKIMNAACYGVPQFRRRLFIVGLNDRPFSFPKPTHGPHTSNAYLTSRLAIREAPADSPNRAIVTYAKKPVMRPSAYDGMLVNGKGRPIDLDEPSQTIPATAGGNRTHIVDELGVFVEYHEYLRSGGKPREGLVEGVRRLTVSESAMIQGFPPDYVFVGKSSSRYRQVGNAVPPGLAEAVARQVSLFLNMDSLDEEESAQLAPSAYQELLPMEV